MRRSCEECNDSMEVKFVSFIENILNFNIGGRFHTLDLNDAFNEDMPYVLFDWYTLQGIYSIRFSVNPTELFYRVGEEDFKMALPYWYTSKKKITYNLPSWW